MITCRAPGKLFVAGEYAVTETGQPAVIMAVDRYATVTVKRACDGLTVESDSLPNKVFRCERHDDRIALVDADDSIRAAFAYTMAAITVVECLAHERGGRHRSFHLEVVGADFVAGDGRKLGLGSSAAVTLATVAAVAAFYELSTSIMDRYRLAMLATSAVNARCSGGDLAAAAWGGWIAYTMPDRKWLRACRAHATIAELLDVEWPGLSIRRMPPPAGLHVAVGWTGQPAESPRMITKYTDQVRARKPREAFLASSAECVDRLIDGLVRHDAAQVKQQIRRARQVLCQLDDATDLGIMTPRLDALCTTAEELGAAAKPSGAGGGDCGIAVIELNATVVDLMHRRWTQAGIRPLELRTHPAEPEVP